MSSFKDLMAKAAANAKPHQQTRDVLFGTGMTQKVAGSAEKQIEAAAKLESKVNDTVENQPVVIDLHIPTALVDKNIVLDESQQAAVDGLVNEQFGCLIGAAGTGKTTSVKQLVARIANQIPLIDHGKLRESVTGKPHAEKLNLSMAFCAFTGKAVQQMKRALPKEYHGLCDTIHGLLGYKPESEEIEDPVTGNVKYRKVFKPTFTEYNKLPHDVVFVDEGGMVPIDLWNKLVAALKPTCRIYLIGDINQLPPVQGRSVLGFAMINWPTFALEKIHRTAEDSAIIENAHRVLHGKAPVSHKPEAGKQSQFVVKTIKDGSLAAYTEVQAILQHLHKQGSFDPNRGDAFIVPQNKGTLGQLNFNEALVRYFNPVQKINGIPVNPRQLIQAGYHTVVFAAGDKVMQLANDREIGLTNGMVGYVKEIVPNNSFKGDRVAQQMDASNFELDADEDMDDLNELAGLDHKEEEDENQRAASHIMKVYFPDIDQLVDYATAGNFKKITHAYAMTCHKMQGSEAATIVVLVHASNIKMLTREWLYTAITRGRERVIILCNNRGLAQAVNIQRIKGKTVKEKAQCFLDLQDKTDTSLPNLPEAKKVEV